MGKFRGSAQNSVFRGKLWSLEIINNIVVIITIIIIIIILHSLKSKQVTEGVHIYLHLKI